MQCQPSIARRSLARNPSQVEVLWRHPPNCGGITGVEPIDRAPDVGRRSAIIHKEGVGPTAAGQEVGASAAIQHIGATVDSDRVGPAAGVNEPVGVKALTFRLSLVTLMYSFLRPATGPLYASPMAGID